ncbi:PKD domain-containing protein, partial [Candidatus Woesearchaeota archaeon]|nr:PKD domain-containing protein [Candidatus Woesearchaeota archaeon]
MKRAVIVLLILSIFVISACSGITGKSTDSDLSEIDKEIKALQEELRKSEDLAEDLGADEEEIDELVETTEKVTDIDNLKLNDDKKPVLNTKKLPKLEVQETETVRLKIEASDADKDAISYTFSKPLDSRGQWKTTYGDAGEYVVTVTASDKKLKTTKDVLIIVKKKNEAPVIKNIADITVTEGQTVRIKP